MPEFRKLRVVDTQVQESPQEEVIRVLALVKNIYNVKDLGLLLDISLNEETGNNKTGYWAFTDMFQENFEYFFEILPNDTNLGYRLKLVNILMMLVFLRFRATFREDFNNGIVFSTPAISSNGSTVSNLEDLGKWIDMAASIIHNFSIQIKESNDGLSTDLPLLFKNKLLKGLKGA